MEVEEAVESRVTESQRELAKDIVSLSKHHNIEPETLIGWYVGVKNIIAMAALPMNLGEWLVMYAASQLPEPSVEDQPAAPYMNAAGHLPPVDCPLLLEVNGELVRGQRTGFLHNKDREMVYELESGETITGRFPWTYP